MNENLTREEIHHAVDRFVEDLLAEAGQIAPPADALALLRKLGLAIRPDPPRRGKPTAMPPTEASEESRQLKAAIQLGEHVKPALLQRLGLSPGPRASMGLSLPNLFAHHFLAPSCWYACDARAADWDILDLKRSYSTATHELLAWRLLDLPEPCAITVVDDDRVTGRRGNAWRVNRILAEAEQECQRYVHHYSRPRRVVSGAWTVQGWPIHRPDWKREILRSVVEEGPELEDES